MNEKEEKQKELLNNTRCIEHGRPYSQCDHGGHYHVFGIKEEYSMDLIKTVFPTGKANDMNWMVGSTSGIHGTYTDLNEIEKSIYIPLAEQKEDECYSTNFTFLIIQPRLVCMTYGTVEVTNQADVDFLKGLIASSVEQIAKTQEENI